MATTTIPIRTRIDLHTLRMIIVDATTKVILTVLEEGSFPLETMVVDVAVGHLGRLLAYPIAGTGGLIGGTRGTTGLEG